MFTGANRFGFSPMAIWPCIFFGNHLLKVIGGQMTPHDVHQILTHGHVKRLRRREKKLRKRAQAAGLVFVGSKDLAVWMSRS